MSEPVSQISDFKASNSPLKSFAGKKFDNLQVLFTILCQIWKVTKICVISQVGRFPDLRNSVTKFRDLILLILIFLFLEVVFADNCSSLTVFELDR